MDEVQRRFEKYLCEKLSGMVPGHLFVPMAGGGESEDADPIEPPVTIVSVNTAENVLSGSGQWKIHGAVQVITHMNEATAAAHSQLSNLIYYHLSHLSPEITESLYFHGLDISAMRSVEESTNKVRVCAIDFAAGIAG